jgi:hypothetical protein
MIKEEKKNKLNSKLKKSYSGIITISLISILILILSFFILKNQIAKFESWNLINGINLISALISVFGLFFSIYNILKLINLTNETKKEIERSLSRLSKAISTSDLATYIQIIQQCQGYVAKNNYDLALLRLQDIKRTLIKIKNISIVKDKDDDFESLITIVTEYITLISESKNNDKRTLNSKIVNSNLEKIVTLFSNLEDNIKFDNNG